MGTSIIDKFSLVPISRLYSISSMLSLSSSSPLPLPSSTFPPTSSSSPMESQSQSQSQSQTHIHDIPDVILTNILSSIQDTRTRNTVSLVCQKWMLIERITRTSLTLRGNVQTLIDVPHCFNSVTHLDLSLLSPWGHQIFQESDPDSNSTFSDPNLTFLAENLQLAFPSVNSLTVYSRTPSTLKYLAPLWPALKHVKLVRWHQRCQSPLGSDLFPLFEYCTSLSSLDLSQFYCWTEDIPAALDSHPSTAAALTCLNLITLPSAEGFKSQELITISAACPNLGEFLVGCMFDPRYIDFVGDEAMVSIARNCPKLFRLHLIDTSSLLNARGDPDDEGYTADDARVSLLTLEEMFGCLPLLEELVLDICSNVRDAGVVLETLNTKCPKLKSVKLGQFHGVCRPVDTRIEGIAVCKGLEELSIKNCADLSDNSLMGIALGCPRLAKFHVQGCKNITVIGLKNFTVVLRKSLVEVSISCCKQIDAASALQAMEPIRSRIQRLHIDCVWCSVGEPSDNGEISNGFDLNESDSEFTESDELFCENGTKRNMNCYDSGMNKKCKYSNDLMSNGNDNDNGYVHRSWDRLKFLSLWIAVGELLSPLHLRGLEICPVLEEIQIKVEGDCRTRAKPSDLSFGLICLTRYPQLSKMKLDCGDVIGYALTAPSGQMDLSLWDRFYLNGIGNLNLYELDYWPPQDRDVNNRGLSLPAAGLIAECTTLRKLFIHGTAHEHWLMMLLKIPTLREMQLREDYYPAPEDDMSTEMRVTSCTRFEAALNGRDIRR